MNAVLSALLVFLSPVLADVGPFINDDRFDKADYGSFPVETYISSTLSGPRINKIQDSPLCDDGLYIFFAPYGPHVQTPGPTILDNHGNLVWMLRVPHHVYNFKAQTAGGKQYLTYWAGDDSVKGHGSGSYYMLDSFYNEVRRFNASNNLPGDLHEFMLTDDGHAIVSVYTPLKVDMTPDAKEPTVGWIWECIFQEIDLDTGEAIFEWKASEHFTLDDIMRPMDHEDHGTEELPIDWFHLNSVDKDPNGNYLVSSRYTHAAHCINGVTGEVLWNFGGKKNSFRDLSNGRATTFVGQHDVRWVDNYTGISVFDNAADWDSKSEITDQSRGVRVALNYDEMTATLVAEYQHPAESKILSVSQGSMQVLPSGNAMVGYGAKGAFTEFSPDGKILCHNHFESESHFERGDAQSYRVLKYAWNGQPSQAPDFEVVGEVGFVSWNGATEVAAWVLQAAADNALTRVEESSFKSVKRVAKMGFETAIALDSTQLGGKVVRVAAVDASGKVIGATRALPVSNSVEESYGEKGVDYRVERAGVGLPIIFVACVGTAALLMGAYELLQRRGRSGKGYRLLA